MPYSVRKQGNSYVVIKDSDDSVVAGNKTKLSKARALKAMKARYAHSSD